MQAVRYSGRLDSDGRIRLPLRMQQRLGVRAGDKIEIFIAKEHAEASSIKSPKNMPVARQRRMNELLARHREGETSTQEKQELERLVMEAQLLTIERAKSLLRKLRQNFNWTRHG